MKFLKVNVYAEKSLRIAVSDFEYALFERAKKDETEEAWEEFSDSIMDTVREELYMEIGNAEDY